MAVVYRYTDLQDEQIKYVGIVWSGNRTLKQRDAEHRKNDDWCKGGHWKVEYLMKKVNNRTDAEMLEAHYIAKFGTDKYFNTRKSGWGTSDYVDDKNDEWELYSTDEEQVSENIYVVKIDNIEASYYTNNRSYIQIFTEDNKKILFAEFGVSTVCIGDTETYIYAISGNLTKHLLDIWDRRNEDDIISVAYTLSEIDGTVEYIKLIKNDEDIFPWVFGVDEKMEIVTINVNDSDRYESLKAGL